MEHLGVWTNLFLLEELLMNWQEKGYDTWMISLLLHVK